MMPPKATKMRRKLWIELDLPLGLPGVHVLARHEVVEIICHNEICPMIAMKLPHTWVKRMEAAK